MHCCIAPSPVTCRPVSPIHRTGNQQHLPRRPRPAVFWHSSIPRLSLSSSAVFLPPLLAFYSYLLLSLPLPSSSCLFLASYSSSQHLRSSPHRHSTLSRRHRADSSNSYILTFYHSFTGPGLFCFPCGLCHKQSQAATAPSPVSSSHRHITTSHRWPTGDSQPQQHCIFFCILPLASSHSILFICIFRFVFRSSCLLSYHTYLGLEQASASGIHQLDISPSTSAVRTNYLHIT